jgi:hypothetical protein
VKYLLIDTTTLLQLIDIEGYNNHLSALEDLLNRGEVSLITHRLIVEEWNNHKTKRQKDKERRLLFDSNKNINRKKNSDNLLPSAPMINIKHIDRQIQQIDELLLSAKVLETTEGIKNEFADRYKKNLAPFHIKKDSLKDWEIIGTVCNFCELYDIKELYFLSHNHTDFADSTNPSRKIHQDIQDRFKRVKINYFKNYSDFFNEFNSVLPTDLISYQIIKSEKFSHKATIKKSVLETLYYLFHDLYQEVNFIPIHILNKLYPFAKDESSSAYYGVFLLQFVNEDLISFFDNIIITDEKRFSFKDETFFNKIDDYKNKTEFVLTRLTQNLIFNLSGEKTRKHIDVHYYNPKRGCECFVCTFNRFEFHKTFKGLSNDSPDLREKLKLAYIHYQVGNYLSANTIYNDIIELATKEKKYIIYFIAKYNIRHLGNFLSNFFFNKKVDQNLIKISLTIDPLEEAVKLKGHTDYNLISFIASQEFFSDAYENIREANEKIRDHYYSQLNGGWSSNQHVWHLITEFVKLDAFLNNNYIIYDNYSNFERLFEMVVEGLFASHAINEKQSSRFTSFDDFWVHKIIVYGKKDTIIKYFNRYKLKSLKYKSTSDEKNSFIELTMNLLTNEQAIRKSIIDFADEDNLFFEEKYNRLFENILVMASLLDLDEGSINQCTSTLLSFLDSQKLLHRRNFGSVKLFLEYNRGKINDETLFKLLNYFSKNDVGYQVEILETLIDNLKTENISRLPEELFYDILNRFVGNNTNNNSQLLVIKLFEKVDNERKDVIKNTIQKILNDNFNFQAYYLYSMNDIISLDEFKILGWVRDFDISKRKQNFGFLSDESEAYLNYYLNELLNLCFKASIDINNQEFEKLKQIHPYYEWLLNMDNFDYSRFDPEWVLSYQTSYYLKRMAKSNILKQALVLFLKENNHYRIERLLIKITYFLS